MSTVIKVEAVAKEFMLPHERHGSLKSTLLNLGNLNRKIERQKVLDGISFSIKSGEFFGIIGRNGSGKSTLLKILAQIYYPTSGIVAIDGKLTPFIELGVGFNPELTGRENVYLNGAMLGFSRAEVDSRYKSIVEFAELERFMDQKLKNYSSGMQVRLAFSIAVQSESDIYLFDEVLAVGDAVFQKKCYDHFKYLKKMKKTVVFVSHDTNALLEYCDKGIVIEDGKIISRGPINSIVNDYLDLLNKVERASDEADGESGAAPKDRWGTGEARITAIDLKGSQAGNHSHIITEADEFLEVAVDFEAIQAIQAPIYGITVLDSAGQRIFASNTMWSKVKTANLAAGQAVTVRWRIPNIFNTGSFIVSPAIADKTGATIYDWAEGFGSFKVRKRLTSMAYTNVEHDLTVSERS